MSIQSEITRITENVANAYSAVEEQGGTLPEAQNTDNLAPAILSIPRGGGSSVEVDGMTILEKDGVISTAIGGGELTLAEPITIINYSKSSGQILWSTSDTIQSLQGIDTATITQNMDAHMNGTYRFLLNDYPDWNEYVWEGMPLSYDAATDTYTFDFTQAKVVPSGVPFTISKITYEPSMWQTTLFFADYPTASFKSRHYELKLIGDISYVDNKFLNLAEFGYQNAEQVQTAITTALSAIGVAEEGAY